MTTHTLHNAILNAESAWETWNASGSTKRIVKLLVAANELNQPMVNWLLKRIGTEMPAAVNLPGPTGEANSLHWAGRGIICVCADINVDTPDNAAFDSAVAAQLFTALATGNVAVLQGSNKYTYRLHSVLMKAGLSESVVQIVTSPLHDLVKQEAFNAYAFCGTDASLIQLNQQLAQRGGTLAQLISETEFESYPTLTSMDYPWRFVTESTISVNTTAVGGNATLLELGGKND